MKKKTNLEGIIGLGTCFGLAVSFANQMYETMDKMGFYIRDKDGIMTNMTHEGFNIQLASILGTAALAFGGLYLGSKIGKFFDDILYEEQ